MSEEKRIKLIDVDGNILHEGDRVYSYDFDGSGKIIRVYGTLHKNVDYPNVSDWYIVYDDGAECAVLDTEFVYKA